MKWHLKDGVGLVVRCEYDAVLPPPNKPTYISIKALNEWDSKVCMAYIYTCFMYIYMCIMYNVTSVVLLRDVVYETKDHMCIRVYVLPTKHRRVCMDVMLGLLVFSLAVVWRDGVEEETGLPERGLSGH